MTGKVLVPPEGSRNSRIAIVGEAPGKQEEEKMRPFIGWSGDVLNELLHQYGVTRSDCYVTNVVKERPPNNDISKFIVFGEKIVKETPEFTAYKHQLREELSTVYCNVIIALGKVSLYALCGHTSITKYRGSILSSTLLPGRKVIPTIHPAAIARDYSYKRLIAFDLARAVEESQTSQIHLPDRTIVTYPNYNEVLDYLHFCRQQCRVAFDIETIGHQVSCISFSHDKSYAMSIPMLSKFVDYWVPPEEEGVWKAIGALLEDTNVLKIAHNAAFDFTMLFRRYGFRIRPIECTMIAQSLVAPDYPKGLDFVTSIHTREPYYKDDGKEWRSMGANEQDFFVYNGKDSAVCLECYDSLLRNLSDIGNVTAFKRQCRLLEVIIEMQERGIPIDTEYLNNASTESMEVQLRELNKFESVAPGLNIRSPAQLKKYFYEEKGYKPILVKTKKGMQITTNAEALKKLAMQGDPVASTIRAYRKEAKLDSTYYRVKIDPDDKLRCAYNPVGEKYGRFTSKENIFGTGTNLQNLTPSFRKAIKAPKGYLFGNKDLSQAEPRVVAFVAPEQGMIDTFEAGLDIHRKTAAGLFNKPYDKVSDEPGSSSLGNGERSERDWGKTCNNALNYNLGVKKFCEKTELPRHQGAALHAAYHELYPGIRENYHRWVKDEVFKNHRLCDPFGKYYLFMTKIDDTLLESAYSFIPQSTVAAVINEWGLCEVYYKPETYYAIEILNQVHDSIFFQMDLAKWGFPTLARQLILLNKSLSQSIHWRGRSFSIPSELKIGLDGRDMVKVKLSENVEEAAARLEQAYSLLT